MARETREHKVFDPADGFAPLTDVVELTDSTLARRGGQWWMYLAGESASHEGIRLWSASLPEGEPLAPTGWRVTADARDPARIALLAESRASAAWDLQGGRHCPCYVKGVDPERGEVERIYYAGAPETPWGPYRIGYLEWDGARWREQAEPVFAAAFEWERGSVYEPNVLYADGLWKMWYVAGSNRDDYLVQGYSESANGRDGWRPHRRFMPAEEKVFDFSVQPVDGGYEAVFSRVWLAPSAPPATTGLWWCRAKTPSPERSDWSEPVQLMTAAERGWHAGPWKPSWRVSESDPGRLIVFFDGGYRKDEPGGFPFAFTLGCLEVERPR